MSADANAQSAQISVAIAMSLEIIQRGTSISIVVGEGFGGFELVAARASRFIVVKNRAGGLIFVINLRHSNDETVARQPGGSAGDGFRHLKNLAPQHDARVFSGG